MKFLVKSTQRPWPPVVDTLIMRFIFSSLVSANAMETNLCPFLFPDGH